MLIRVRACGQLSGAGTQVSMYVYLMIITIPDYTSMAVQIEPSLYILCASLIVVCLLVKK